MSWTVTAKQWAKPCPSFTAPLKTLLICICILGVKRKGCACDVSLGNACEETQTSKNCGSTFLIPCGAVGKLCQSALVIVGHWVPLRGKAVLPYPRHGQWEGVGSHSVFKERTSISSLLKHLFWLLSHFRKVFEFCLLGFHAIILWRVMA